MHGLSASQQIHEAGVVGDGEGAALLPETCGLVSKTRHRKQAQTEQSIPSKCAAETGGGKGWWHQPENWWSEGSDLVPEKTSDPPNRLIAMFSGQSN